MGKLSDLLNKGVRMIVVEKGEPKAEAPSSPMPEPAPMVEEPVASQVPADVADFAAVYQEADITQPAHGYGVEKAAEMLANKRLATMSREVKATAIITALEAAGVPIEDVVKDAARRDRALDTFERAKRQELDQLKAQSAARIQKIEEEMQLFLREKNAEIEALKQAVDVADKAFAELQIRKRREEERLFATIAHFVADMDNPVTVASQSAQAAAKAETSSVKSDE
jgi:hypothetical protein